MALTDTQIRTAKPRERAFKLSDSGGLHLLVASNGTKSWRLAYRYAGKQKAIGFGRYPTVSLAKARSERDSAKQLLGAGADPSAQRKLDKIAAESGNNTFRAVAEELLTMHRREGRVESTLKKNRWLLEVAYQTFGQRPIGEVTAPELLSALRKFEDRGRYESARRLRTVCGMVFRFAIATGRATRDLSVDLRGAIVTPRVKHRAAIVDPPKVGALLRAIDDYDGQPTTKGALQLAPHVFVRPGELRSAEWTEFDFDKALWTIPPEKMKMKRPHRVPLSHQALHTLRHLRKLTGWGRFVFPSVLSPTRPISENTLNAALRRMGYTREQLSAHGFRSTASTLLNEMGRWNPDAIERQLAHQEDDDVRRAYMHAAEFWNERVQMMQAWSNYLDELRGQGHVITLKSTL